MGEHDRSLRGGPKLRVERSREGQNSHSPVMTREQPRTKEDTSSRAFAHYGARSKYTKNKLLKYWVEMNKKGNINNFTIFKKKNIEANIPKTIFLNKY